MFVSPPASKVNVKVSSSVQIVRPASAALVLELCSGSGTLTAEFRRAGFDGIAIDWSRNRFFKRAPTMVIDLSSAEGLHLVLGLISSYDVIFVHAGVPCGTCSRAREKPIPMHLRKQGAPEPRPLRDERFPMGKPNLKPHEKQMVEQANQVYANVVTILRECNVSHGLWKILLGPGFGACQ